MPDPRLAQEWLPSTPKHLALYKALQLRPPKFAHLPLLVNADGSKLSKRAGDVKVEDYIARGYEPEALLNFVALLGWSPQGAQRGEHGAPAAEGSAGQNEGSDVLPMADLVKLVSACGRVLCCCSGRCGSGGIGRADRHACRPGLVWDGVQFSLSGVNKNRPTMSTAKLDFLNRAHLQLKLEDEHGEARREVAERLGKRLKDTFGASDRAKDLAYLGRVMFALKVSTGLLGQRRKATGAQQLMSNAWLGAQERIHTLADVPTLGSYFFVEPDLASAGALQLQNSVKPDVAGTHALPVPQPPPPPSRQSGLFSLPFSFR